MADSDMQGSMQDAADPARGAARRTAETAAQTARKTSDAASDVAKSGVEAEQRTFAAAGDAGRESAAAIGQAAQTSLKAGQEIARHGQDLARKASDQAADLWRHSLTPMAQMTGELNSWFEQMWRRAATGGLRGGLPMAMLAPFTGHPLADLRETEQGFELCVDLPGLKPANIALTLRGDTLVVSGEKAEEAEAGLGAYRFAERRLGRVERAFALPPGADREQIAAAYQDGVLRITIPASREGEQGRTIPIRG